MLRKALPLALFAALALSGCTSLADVADGTVVPGASTPEAQVDPSVTCTDGEPVVIDMDQALWRHPTNAFFDGTEETLPTPQDLEHILRNDAAIIVIYEKDTFSAAELSPLRTWIDDELAAVAMPSSDEQPALAPIEVRVGDTVKLCDGIDVVRFKGWAADRDLSDQIAHDPASPELLEDTEKPGDAPEGVVE
ncbi:hypothetical protein M2152_001961 [Microbacteriaceae bacterium SG_E_30_P1]|uniref:Secreted protein n=1 Tax=Antiquaquibacter oligotrophicus TaxID=2880260 RepID=A0ABT6KRE5_9MICO|nr:hypothetical protein [Antiquaquibacter oligotrophicus]MDH6181779.1 hypothetical protein [Antiquaquibacter oligotrophicus]UDF12541.1 hypothetical protein LH407_10295 [Antiquaquibacter oligotrophicus]